MDRPRPDGTYPELLGADREEAAKAIKGELTAAAAQVIVPARGWEFVEGNRERASQLQEGFLRGRRIMTALAADRNWESTTGLWALADVHAQTEDMTIATTILLQLIILSRIVVADPYTGLHPSKTREEIGLLRTELGLTEADPGRFPGVTLDAVVEAICSGRVRIGNPDQPDPYGVHLH